jgi:hypothetical protein
MTNGQADLSRIVENPRVFVLTILTYFWGIRMDQKPRLQHMLLIIKVDGYHDIAA